MVSLLGKTLTEKYNEYDDSKPKGDILKRKHEVIVNDNDVDDDDNDDDDDDNDDDVKVEIPIKIATPISKVSNEYDLLVQELRCYKDGKFIDLRKEKGTYFFFYHH